MLKKRKALLLALALLSPVACDRSSEPAALAPTPAPTQASVSVEVHVDDLEPRAELPSEYTCDGNNVPPTSMRWEGPLETKEWVLTMTDPDAPGGEFTHWVLYGMGAEITSFANDEIVRGATSEGTNDFGDTGYGGPCPPEGDAPHHYVFTVYALNKTVTSKLPDGTDYDTVVDAMGCCVIGEGTFIATYGR